MPVVLYKAYEAGTVTVNGTTTCSGCGKTYSCDNPEHKTEVSITYDKYTEGGLKEYGFAVALASNVQDGKPFVINNGSLENASNNVIIKAEINEDIYSAVEFKLTGDFSEHQDTEFLMAMYIYDGSDLVYVQSTEDSDSTEVESIAPVKIGVLPIE